MRHSMREAMAICHDREFFFGFGATFTTRTLVCGFVLNRVLLFEG